MPTFLMNLNLDKYNKKHLGILFLVGVLLVIITMPTASDDESQEAENGIEEGSVLTSSESWEWDYKTLMEEELIALLQQVDGVGKVDVMITLQSTSENLVEKDMYTSENTLEETTIYQENSTGEEPYVYQQIYPTIEGVVVIATGGDNGIVIQNITEAIQALFDVDSHKIKIMKMVSDE